jgi:K+/H+ antiporter YhaU regulatory subunit KhtT
MAKAKYQQYFEQMIKENQDLFKQFKLIHDQYAQDPYQYQEELNQKGQPVVDIIRDWERRLCAAMGRTRYSRYSEQLSEKFWNLVREEFDQIDMVGVKIEK